MTGTNKILVVTEPGSAAWSQAPMPEPREEEVMIRVEAISTCPHWDIRIFSGIPMFESRPLTYPYIPGEPGHEACGIVEATGSKVTEFRVGDRVVMWRDPGGRRQGCYARYVAVDQDHLLKPVGTMPPEKLAPLELAMCVQVSFDQLETIDAVKNKHVLVGGLGPAGLIAVQMARAYGARKVTGTDLEPARRQLGLAAGADSAIHPDELPELADSEYETGLDTTGLAVAINQMIGCTRNAVAVFGVMRERIGFGPEHWWGGFTLMGYGEHNKSAAKRALELVEKDRIDLSLLISKELPLSAYAEGVSLLKQKKAIKILFNPWIE
ncbi:MAG: alcohol dehydrogenase catalytic domain-containing protein [Rhodothermales bacterium]|nr:alcohol dehydrogenase catalytic domain-containing protein [Rhodothermales bacterium]